MQNEKVEEWPRYLWVSRVENLRIHLKLIRDHFAGDDSAQAECAVRQAQAGMDAADEYLANPARKEDSHA